MIKQLCIFILILSSCAQNSHQKLSHNKTDVLDSIRMKAKAAMISLNHPRTKISIVCRDIKTRQGIDSLFAYIGAFNPDTSCVVGGKYNYFGEIFFYEDTAELKDCAQLYFVLNGECAGLYLQFWDYLGRYQMTEEGKKYFSGLTEEFKDFLQGHQ